MDDKFDKLFFEWEKSHPEVEYGEWMYYQGCIAQARADRETVDGMVLERHRGFGNQLLRHGDILELLATARIVKGSK
jgi:hypothetical protein